MFKNRISFIATLIASFFLFACVPVRQYNDLKDKNAKCEEERTLLQNNTKDLTVKNTEFESQIKEINKRINALMTDTTVVGISLRKMTEQYDKINLLNDELMKKMKQRNVENSEETRKLLAELQVAKEDLQKKEDALHELEKSLDLKKKNLEELKAELDDKNKQLELKNKRLFELERILNSKDSLVKDLKNKVVEALTGFEGNGLTIEQKNGKVYVSLEEKLLFKSGKWDVDPKGQTALKKLSAVLEKNQDINVMIEGHTDDLAYKGSGGVDDNWDLSVKRATAIVKIILKDSKVDPIRITAAGHGEFLPVDSSKTSEARAKNRRTEIILTPKLDKLFQILETN